MMGLIARGQQGGEGSTQLGRTVYGCNHPAEKLVGCPGATTPWPEKPEDQLEAEEELLQRLVDLNHQRAAEEAKGKIRWLRPDYQAPEGSTQQGELATDADEAANKPTSKQANQPTSQPKNSPGQRHYKPKSELSAPNSRPAPWIQKP